MDSRSTGDQLRSTPACPGRIDRRLREVVVEDVAGRRCDAEGIGGSHLDHEVHSLAIALRLVVFPQQHRLASRVRRWILRDALPPLRGQRVVIADPAERRPVREPDKYLIDRGHIHRVLGVELVVDRHLAGLATRPPIAPTTTFHLLVTRPRWVCISHHAFLAEFLYRRRDEDPAAEQEQRLRTIMKSTRL